MTFYETIKINSVCKAFNETQYYLLYNIFIYESVILRRNNFFDWSPKSLDLGVSYSFVIF